MTENIIRGFIGIGVLIGICYLLSSDRKQIDWKLVAGGVLLQFILALSILYIPFVHDFFQAISDGFVNLINFAENGANFVFGNWPSDAVIQHKVVDANGDMVLEPFSIGYMFAFKVLPTVVFFSALSALLYYFGILQRITYGIAWFMSKFMNLSGPEALAAAANVFIGQTEAPLVIKPYLSKLSTSELACLMVGGFSTIAGGVFALFVSLLGAEYAIHFLTASIISAPAAIVCAKIIRPESDPDHVKEKITIPKDKLGSNPLDAISLGTTDGVRLAVNVVAMLLVIIALVALVNAILFGFGNLIGINETIASATNATYNGLSLEYLLGLLFSPIAYIIGVPWTDAMYVGQLLGKKMAINEVVAYVDLKNMISEGSQIHLTPKSIIIATYALCGFANFASIGIQIGGISALAPSQREALTRLGFITMIGGTIAALMTGCIAGMLLG